MGYIDGWMGGGGIFFLNSYRVDRLLTHRIYNHLLTDCIIFLHVIFSLYDIYIIGERVDGWGGIFLKFIGVEQLLGVL